jgi:hypothetical protein
MIGERSRLSLAQYLGLQAEGDLDVLFRKHGLRSEWVQLKESFGRPMDALMELLPGLAFDRLIGLVDEVVSTEGYFRERAIGNWGEGRDSYLARRGDLERCLRLDNYDVAGGVLRAIEPELPGSANVEDAVATEVGGSRLPHAAEILAALRRSAQDFTEAPPDYNGCLSNARVALETLARDIAAERRRTRPASFDEASWGAVIGYLRQSGFLSGKEENLICRVYDLLSEGAHVPVGFTEEDWVRLGRGMAMSSAYLLIKRYKGGA